jgi:hypothetical protein
VLGLSVLYIVPALRFFNPNAQRARIAAWVTHETGRNFTFEGELERQLWPHPTLPQSVLWSLPEDVASEPGVPPITARQDATVPTRGPIN